MFEYRLNPEQRYGWGRPAHAGLVEILAAGHERYAEVIEVLLGLP